MRESGTRVSFAQKNWVAGEFASVDGEWARHGPVSTHVLGGQAQRSTAKTQTRSTICGVSVVKTDPAKTVQSDCPLAVRAVRKTIA